MWSCKDPRLCTRYVSQIVSVLSSDNSLYMLQRMAIREDGYQTYFAGLPPHPASTGSSHDVHFSPSWGLNNSSTKRYWEPKSLEIVWRFIWRNADPKWLHRLKVALSPVHLCTTLELEPTPFTRKSSKKKKDQSSKEELSRSWSCSWWHLALHVCEIFQYINQRSLPTKKGYLMMRKTV